MREPGASGRDEFEAVLGKQRRRVVAALATTETIAPTPIVRDDEVLSSEQYVTLVYELHHVHLPALDADGVIEFDRAEETVRRGAQFGPSYRPGDPGGGR